MGERYFTNRVLIVEDDLVTAQMLFKNMKKCDPYAEVVVCPSAESAFIRMEADWDNFGESPYSLIILDIFLEDDATGIDLAISAREYFGYTPTIFISSTDEGQFKNLSANRCQYNAYMTKPLSGEQCRREFEKYLNRGL